MGTAKGAFVVLAIASEVTYWPVVLSNGIRITGEDPDATGNGMMHSPEPDVLSGTHVAMNLRQLKIPSLIRERDELDDLELCTGDREIEALHRTEAVRQRNQSELKQVVLVVAHRLQDRDRIVIARRGGRGTLEAVIEHTTARSSQGQGTDISD